MEKTIFLIAIILISACVSTGKVVSQQNISPVEETEKLKQSDFQCEGYSGCYYGTVTRIIDGDTIQVENVRIRLVLVDAPEATEPGGFEAAKYIHDTCPVGSQAIIDQDDWQLYDSYGRMLGVVWCNGHRLNEEIVQNGLANIFYRYCPQSEFGDDDWARRLGC